MNMLRYGLAVYMGLLLAGAVQPGSAPDAPADAAQVQHDAPPHAPATAANVRHR